MTLVTDLTELADRAVDDDLQSVTGVWLRGFLTDFSKALSKIREFASSGTPAEQAPWLQILRALDYTYSDTPYINAQGGAIKDVSVAGVMLAKPLPSINTMQLAKRLSIDPRDYNFFNKLLGFGANGERLSQIVAGVGQQFGLSPAIIGDPTFIIRYCELINLARGRRPGHPLAVPVDAAGNIIPPAGANPADAIIYEDDSRLYLKLDLTEWLFINSPDILHVVVELPQTLHGYYPLGRTTVWLPAEAQIQHVRSKTAKTFLRGQIAKRLRIEDVESNLAGFVNTIFDTDSEQAYSSTTGPC